MSFKRVVLMTLAVLCAVAAATPARAGSQMPPCYRPIGAITLTPESSGTVIRVSYEGREKVRLLQSRDPLAALAVADVDNDGDLDILAAREGGGLVLWRNNGRGRFFSVAHAPGRAELKRRQTDIRNVLVDSAPIQSGDDRFDAALPRAPDAALDSVDTPHPARPASLLSGAAACHPGRAPPATA